MMAGKPSPQPNYHSVRINQSCKLTRWDRAWRAWGVPQAEGQALDHSLVCQPLAPSPKYVEN